MKRDFRFQLTWLKNPDCLKRIQEIWIQPTRDHVALDRVLFKLKKVKKFLKGWDYNKSGRSKQRKKLICEQLIDLE
jgi:hypothetical protein